jgi:RNA polymerase primary sigma factor
VKRGQRRSHAAKPLHERIAAVLKREGRPLRAFEIARVLEVENGRRVQSLVVEQEMRRHVAMFRSVTGERWSLLSPARAGARSNGTAERAAELVRPKPPSRNQRKQVAATRSVDWIQVNPRLYQWQTEALLAWDQHDRHGVIQAVTGAGKTAVGMAAIDDHVHKGGAAVVVVPTIELMNQWEGNLRRWERPLVPIGRLGGGHRDPLGGNAVLVSVAVSAARRIPEAVQASLRPVLLVADECHRYGAKTFSQALEAPFAATLGLSATPERTDGQMEMKVFPALGDVIYELGYEEALAHGVINEFEVIFVGVAFRHSEELEYLRYSEEITDRLDRIRFRYPALDAETIFEQLDELYEETGDKLFRMLQASVSHRRQVLNTASARREFVLWAVQGCPAESRVLLFHELIDECEELAALLSEAGIPADAHHSQLTKEARRRALRGFERGWTRALVAPRTLDEGIDVPDADVGIIVAGSRRLRQRIQRAGRVLRKAPGKDVSRVFVVYVENTVEDPNTSYRRDEFADAIAKLGRAHTLAWPEDKSRLTGMLEGVV